MTALMGPSGAGKSTLLDVLSKRKNTGTVEGEILINGKVCFLSLRTATFLVKISRNQLPHAVLGAFGVIFDIFRNRVLRSNDLLDTWNKKIRCWPH